ncbi:acyl carrier protein [Neiella marina]|uniref:Acyl carrier protein n=1 Tax=Neiella holothuriorum TaxID=2870530 RepID=A0ABS7EF14_9GAMM|nr:acyl carrier protein [Neiella holothuriorum]MBW8190820.1 acyl carrier protein [Neiella holothuriorum]
MSLLQTIFEETFKISYEEANQDLAMQDVANWDSLTHMDLISAIEDKLAIRLSSDEIADMTSFDAIKRIVNEHQ